MAAAAKLAAPWERVRATGRPAVPAEAGAWLAALEAAPRPRAECLFVLIEGCAGRAAAAARSAAQIRAAFPEAALEVLCPEHPGSPVAGAPALPSRAQYCVLLLEPRFYARYEDCGRIVVTQTDVRYLRAPARPLASFMHFDYVGAPFTAGPRARRAPTVGNGGFSLRNPRRMRAICESHASYRPLSAYPHEDAFFAALTPADGLAPVEDAYAFSQETLLPEPPVRPLGVHKIWAYHRAHWLRELEPHAF